MEFNCKVEMDNAAFEDDAADELGRILHKVTYQVRNGETAGTLRDANGNRVGSWSITGETDA